MQILIRIFDNDYIIGKVVRTNFDINICHPTHLFTISFYLFYKSDHILIHHKLLLNPLRSKSISSIIISALHTSLVYTLKVSKEFALKNSAEKWMNLIYFYRLFLYRFNN